MILTATAVKFICFLFFLWVMWFFEKYVELFKDHRKFMKWAKKDKLYSERFNAALKKRDMPMLHKLHYAMCIHSKKYFNWPRE